MKDKYYLNFTNLNEDAQDRLIQNAINDLEDDYGKEELGKEAKEMNINYNTFIREKAEEHIYSFDFEFNM